MATGLLGKKLGMTRIYAQDGRSIPVTVLEAGPCTVVQRKTRDKDGYEAVQIGFGGLKASHCNKPQAGHFAKAGVAPLRTLREMRVDSSEALKPGDEICADIFQAGDRVDVFSTSKGKGFSGVMKRHGYRGGPGTHGSTWHRRPGAIGACADPAETIKGKGMPGQLGNSRVTVQNLEVVTVDTDKNLVLIRGSVPGANGGLIFIRKSVKGAK
jgi:large subunit ribosomal protein L3